MSIKGQLVTATPSGQGFRVSTDETEYHVENLFLNKSRVALRGPLTVEAITVNINQQHNAATIQL